MFINLITEHANATNDNTNTIPNCSAVLNISKNETTEMIPNVALILFIF